MRCWISVNFEPGAKITQAAKSSDKLPCCCESNGNSKLVSEGKRRRGTMLFGLARQDKAPPPPPTSTHPFSLTDRLTTRAATLNALFCFKVALEKASSRGTGEKINAGGSIGRPIGGVRDNGRAGKREAIDSCWPLFQTGSFVFALRRREGRGSAPPFQEDPNVPGAITNSMDSSARFNDQFAAVCRDSIPLCILIFFFYFIFTFMYL